MSSISQSFFNDSHFSSTSILQPNILQNANLVGSRIISCYQHLELLAQKDLRIEELLKEVQSCKDEASFKIKQLQQNITQLLSKNRDLETEISELLRQRGHSIIEKLPTDESIEQSIPNILQGAHNIEKGGKEKLVIVSEAVEKVGEGMKDSLIMMIEGNDTESINKSNILSCFQQQSQCLQQGISRGRLRALEEKEKLLFCFAECFTKQLGLNEEQANSFLNEPLECIISTFLESLKEHQEKRKELKEFSQRQSRSILDLEQVIEQQIFERMQISNEKNELKKDLDSFQVRPNQQLKELKEKFNKLLEEKKIVELELFRMKMDIEESKNMTTLELRNMVDSIGEQERLNNDSPSTIEERAESQEESNRNSLIFSFNNKIEQLTEIVAGKEAQLKVLSSRYKSHAQSLEAIFELSKDFDLEFSSYVDSSQTSRSEIFERIGRSLKSKVVPLVTVDMKGHEDEFEENLLDVQNA